MKRKDQETVERLVSGWMTGADKHQFMDDECRRGSSVQSKIVKYGGQLPGSSGFRETISKRADRMRNFELSAFERTAYQLIQSFPEVERKLLVLWPLLKKRYNPDTKEVYRKADIAVLLGMSKDDYEAQRERVSMELIKLYGALLQKIERKNESALLNELT